MVQVYENEESREVTEEDLAAILGIMLGVKDVELSGLFLALDGPDPAKITYGKTQCVFATEHQLQHKTNYDTFVHMKPLWR